MIRIVAFLLALWPCVALAETFDQYVLGYSPTDYWSLAADANDQGSAAINGSCTGTCTYGQSLTTYVNGFVPGTSTSYITVNQAFSTPETLQLGAFFKAASNGDTATQYLVNQTGSVSNSINLHFSDSGCSGEFDVVVIIGGASTVTCMPRLVNDGTAHFFFVQCNTGNGGFGYVDGIEVATFTCAFDTPQAASYTLGNATSTYPVLGAMGAVMYWQGATLLTQWQINAIWQGALTGSFAASTPPPPPCFPRPGMTLEWCDAVTYAGCDQGTYAWRNGPVGPVSGMNTGASFSGIIQPTTAIGTIAGFTLTIDSISAGAFAPGDVVTGTGVTSGTTILAQLTGGGTGQTGTYSLSASSTVASPETIGTTNYKINPSGATLALGDTIYDNGAQCDLSGNNTVLNQTQIASALVASNWYLTTPAQTVTATTMWPGLWSAGSTYLQTNIQLGANSLVVGQDGGGLPSGGYTARYIPTPLSPGQEVTFLFWAWFSALTVPSNYAFNWTGYFGFSSSDVASGYGSVAYVEFGSQGSPPTGYVNLNVQLNNIGSIGNMNCPGNGWQLVVLDIKRSTGSDGLVSFQACGQTISYSGQTDYGGLGANDQVFLAGQFVDSEVDAEAYFTDIGVYTGHYTPPYYPPGGGGPHVIWLQ